MNLVDDDPSVLTLLSIAFLPRREQLLWMACVMKPLARLQEVNPEIVGGRKLFGKQGRLARATRSK